MIVAPSCTAPPWMGSPCPKPRPPIPFVPPGDVPRILPTTVKDNA